mgnify:CR=1 FL=1
MTGKLRDLVDALDAEIRDVSRNAESDLGGLEMQLRVWLEDISTVRLARARRARGRCSCGRRLEHTGKCRQGCVQ